MRLTPQRRAPAPVTMPSKRAQAMREHLTFSLGTVPGRGLVEAGLAAEAKPTFATAAYAEPRDWGYLGLMAFTAVLLLRPQDQIRVLEPLHLAEVFAIIGIAPMVIHRITQRLPVFRITPETVALMAFAGVMFLTMPFSVWPGGAWNVLVNGYLKILIVFILMLNTLTTPKRIERLVWLIVVCCGYIAARALVDYARGVNLVEDDRLAGPVSGIFGNPNDLAMSLVTFLPAAALFAMSRRFPRGRRFIAAVSAVAMLAVVILTKSRGGSLGLLTIVALLVITGRKVRSGIGRITLICVLVTIPLMPLSFWSRMSSIMNEKEDKEYYSGSREARRLLMQEAVAVFMERPLTGVGAGQFREYNPSYRTQRWREAHNVLLQVAADLGILGLIAFAFLIFRAIRVSALARRNLRPGRARGDPDPLDAAFTRDERQSLNVQMIAMSVGLVGWFVCAMFASVAYNWTFYYPLAIVVATYELTKARLAAARSVAVGEAPPSMRAARRTVRLRPATGAI